MHEQRGVPFHLKSTPLPSLRDNYDVHLLLKEIKVKVKARTVHKILSCQVYAISR